MTQVLALSDGTRRVVAVGGDQPPAAPPAPAKKPRSIRKLLLLAVALVALGAGGYYGYDWWTNGRFMVSTDDAYVSADAATIAPKIAGYIKSVAVATTAGSPPARRWSSSTMPTTRSRSTRRKRRSPPRRRRWRGSASRSPPARRRSPRREAQLASAKAAVDNARANSTGPSALAGKSVRHQAGGRRRRAPTCCRRSRPSPRRKPGCIAARANVGGDRGAEDRGRARARPGQGLAATRPQLNLDHTVIRAPYDGVVGNRAAEPGEYRPARPAADGGGAARCGHIDANFKETQLADLQPGQTVDGLGRRLSRPRDQGHGREHRAGVRLGLQPAAARQRHRQLHQDRPARAGAHPPRRRASPQGPDPARHVGGRRASIRARPRPASRRANRRSATWPPPPLPSGLRRRSPEDSCHAAPPPPAQRATSRSSPAS